MNQQVCPACAFANSSDAQFCNQCGIDLYAPLPSSIRPLPPNSPSPAYQTDYQTRQNLNEGNHLLAVSTSNTGKWWNEQPEKVRTMIKLGIIVFGLFFLAFISTLGRRDNRVPRNRDGASSSSSRDSSRSKEAAKASTPEPPTPPVPQTTPDIPNQEETMVNNLAIIDGVQRDENQKTRIRNLLTELDTKYPENVQQIGDMTTAAYNQIEKKGKHASIIEIMEAMSKAANPKQKTMYADSITAYILSRIK